MGEAFASRSSSRTIPARNRSFAAELVAKAPPDGHTLALMGASGPIVVNPATYAKLPYNSLTSFAPVTIIGSFPLVLVVGEAEPFRSVAELVAFAKAPAREGELQRQRRLVPARDRALQAAHADRVPLYPL